MVEVGRLPVVTRNKLLLITDGNRRLFRKQSFVLLWTGQTVSVFGDAFFNCSG